MNTMTRADSISIQYSDARVKILANLMSKVEFGEIIITLPNKSTLKFSGEREGVSADLQIYDLEFIDMLLSTGDIGLGESYMLSMWDSKSINNLIRFGIENEERISKAVWGNIFKLLTYKIKHYFNKNTKRGSKKNIVSHYDLGNSFYKLWLDQTMSYSSALWNEGDSESLEVAQINKYQRILDDLNLPLGAHILEVGCGWGGFMDLAVKNGFSVTGVTISDEQFVYSKERLKEYGAKADVRLMDYRDIEGKFDAIVSIEMFEAIGREFWSTYFDKVSSLLRPGGKAIIQTITIRNDRFNLYKKGTDFIQQYIFKGGFLPSPEVFLETADKADLNVVNSYEFGKDYAKTLNSWFISFNNEIGRVKNLGFSDEFIRMWRFYLKYCQGGFEAERVSVYQFSLERR